MKIMGRLAIALVCLVVLIGPAAGKRRRRRRKRVAHKAAAALSGAVDLMAEGRRAEGVVAFEQATAIGPHLPDAWVGLARALYQSGERILDDRSAASKREATQRALGATRRALALKPASADTHVAVGVLLQDLHRNDEALQAFSAAVDLNQHVPPPTPFGNVCVLCYGRCDRC